MEISAKDNTVIADVRLLLSQAKHRRQTGRFVIEGVRLCMDAVRSRASISVFLYTARAAEVFPDEWKALAAAAERSVAIAEQLSAFISDTTTPQGFFAVCADVLRPLDPAALRPHGRYLALETVRDPANLGTIIRTAEAFGLDGLILSDDCCDVTSPKVLRGSMGGIFRLPIAVTGDFAAALNEWQALGVPVYACVPDREARPISSVSFAEGGIALIGNEANGLRPATVRAASAAITIPMRGRAESLNAAVAASIVAWEMTR